MTLDPRQSHHLVRVLRIRKGDGLEIFDGTGRVWSAEVTRAEFNACTIERGHLVALATPPSPEIHLAPALLKSDAMDRLVRQATELGVAHIWPLASARSQVGGRRAAARYGHWQRIVVSACEQSRRAHLTHIHGVRDFAEFVNQADPGETLLLHPGREALPRNLPHERTMVLVGPEGGWTDGELSRAESLGIRAFGLGDLVLRAETAPLAAAAAIRHASGWR